MKKLFYEEWHKKRLQKIINIFGENWFAGKNILELGAAHGDIGFALSKLGADVTFSDIEIESLESIEKRCADFGYVPDVIQLNQEHHYNLNKKFDLVLHLSVLYHIENWQQDLLCALSHSKICILETKVCIDNNNPNYNPMIISDYSSKSGKISLFSQEEIERLLVKNNYKFLRFDDSALNTNISNDGGGKHIQHLYDWNYDMSESLSKRTIKNERINTHFRRFWLILN